MYGEDNRVEGFEEPDDALRDYALLSTAAIVRLDDVVFHSDGTATLDDATLAETHGLCEGEPFADQPNPAFCTAVLVGDDLVLTAGHCMALLSCPKVAFVFAYHYESPDLLRPIAAEDVYRCDEVLTAHVSGIQAPAVVDYAWVRLERVVSPGLWPVEVSAVQKPVAHDASLTVIGHSAGGPVKVARGGEVLDSRSSTLDYFAATIDNTRGGSGSGVFDDEGALVGIAARGSTDFVPTLRGCSETNRLARVATASDAEEATYVAAAVRGLCAERPDAARDLCAELQSRRLNSTGCAVSRPSTRGAGGAAWALLFFWVALCARTGTRRGC